MLCSCKWTVVNVPASIHIFNWPFKFQLSSYIIPSSVFPDGPNVKPFKVKTATRSAFILKGVPWSLCQRGCCEFDAARRLSHHCPRWARVRGWPPPGPHPRPSRSSDEAIYNGPSASPTFIFFHSKKPQNLKAQNPALLQEPKWCLNGSKCGV